MHKKASLEISIQAIIIIVLAMVLLSLGIVFIRGQFGKIIDIGGQVTDQIREQILDDLRRGDKKLSFPSNDIQIERNKAVTIAIGVKNIEPSDLKFGILVYSIDKNDGEAGKPDDLRRGDKKLSFPSNDIQIERNKAVTIAIGVKNINPSSLKFGLVIYAIDPDDGTLGAPDSSTTPLVGFQYNKAAQSLELQPTEANVYPVRIKAGTDSSTQQYKLVIHIAQTNPCPSSTACVSPTANTIYVEKDFFITTV